MSSLSFALCLEGCFSRYSTSAIMPLSPKEPILARNNYTFAKRQKELAKKKKKEEKRQRKLDKKKNYDEGGAEAVSLENDFDPIPEA